jgi:hypothetical protein
MLHQARTVTPGMGNALRSAHDNAKPLLLRIAFKIATFTGAPFSEAYAKRRNPVWATGPFNSCSTSFRFNAPAITPKASSTAVR